jgi:hypothetical protein
LKFSINFHTSEDKQAYFTPQFFPFLSFGFHQLIQESFPNVIASIRHAWLGKWPFVRCEKKMKLNSNLVSSGSKKCKRGYEEYMVGSGGVCVWQESGSCRRNALTHFI